MKWESVLAFCGGLLVLCGIALPERTSTAISPPQTSDVRRYRPIESIRVGDRVESNNPQATSAERSLADPDPTTWRRLSLRMTKADGHALAIELLRPAEWIAEVGATVGGTIQLNMPELGAQGEAKVLAITACPAVKKGAGRVVTGTFKHEVAGGVVQVTLADSTGKVVDRIGATSNHPFWSEDRQDFIPAGQLHVDEAVRTFAGDGLRVASVLPRPGPATVYNLEVQGEHTYYVGTRSTLVHNEGCYASLPVIGRLKDTETYRNDPRFEVLPTEGWTLESNARWIENIIAAKRPVKLATTPSATSLVNVKTGEPSVYSWELWALLHAGYRQVGNVLLPP